MGERTLPTISGKFVEHTPLFLPKFQGEEDGIELKLGSLWDCKFSKIVKNLITCEHKDIDPKYLAAIPRRILDYKLTHIKSTKDKITSMSVGIDATLTVLFGIKLNVGSAHYSNSIQSSFTSEELQLHYSQDNYVVRLLPSYFAEKQFTGDDEIPAEATHIVTEVIVGGEVLASITFQDVRTTELETQSSSGLGSLIIGPISSGVQAGLSAIAAEPGNESTLEIIFESTIEALETPDSVNSMFEKIDQIESKLKKIQEFPKLNEERAYGNPIKFLLLPISHFIKGQGLKEPKYKVIENAILQEFMEMIQTLMDYKLNVPEEETRKVKEHQISDSFVGKRVVYADSRLKPILFDANSKLANEVIEKNAKIKSDAGELYDNSKTTFEEFKNGTKKIEDIKTLIEEYKKKFSSLDGEIENFIQTGKSLLRIIKADDVDPEVKAWFMFSQEKLCEWKEKKVDVKILLTINYKEETLNNSNETTPSLPFGTFRHLYKMSKHFPDGTVGIVVLPLETPSSKLELFLGTSTEPKAIPTEEILWTLELIQTAYGIDLGNNHVYYHYLSVTAFNSEPSLTLPLTGTNLAENLSKIITLANELKDIKFFESLIPFRRENVKQEKQTNSYFIVTTTDGLNSIDDRIVNFNKLKAELVDFPNISWGVTTFDSSSSEDAPQLFIIHNQKLIGICFDNLDIWLLKYILSPDSGIKESEAPNEISKYLLATTKLKNSLHPERVEFSLKIQQILQPNFSDDSAINSLKISTTGYNIRPDVLRVIKLTKTLLGLENDDINFLQVLTTCTLETVKDKNSLLVTLRNNYWQDSTQIYAIPKGQESTWTKKIFPEFLDYLSTMSRFLSWTVTAYKTLEFLKKSEEDANPKGEETSPPLSTLFDEYMKHEYWTKSPDLQKEMKTLFEQITLSENVESISKAMDLIVNKVIALDKIWENHNDTWDLYRLFGVIKEIGYHTTLLPAEDGKFISKPVKLSILKEYAKKVVENFEFNNNLYLNLSTLQDLQLEPWFKRLRDLVNSDGLSDEFKFLESLHKLELTTAQKSFIWQNPKFVKYIEIGLKSKQFIQLLIDLEAPEYIIPVYIPSPIASVLLDYIRSNLETAELPLWKTEWETLEDLLLAFQSVVAFEAIPETFGHILRLNLIRNLNLKEELKSIEALFYWDEEKQLLLEPWDSQTISKAIDLIMEHKATIKLKEIKPKPFKIVPQILENNKILTIAQQYGPQFLRRRITLHRWSRPDAKKFNDLWNTDPIYKETMEYLLMIFMLPSEQRISELRQLSIGLKTISLNFSRPLENVAERHIKALQALLTSEEGNSSEKIQSLENQLKQTYKELCMISLDKLDFYREIQSIRSLYNYHGISIPALQQFDEILRKEFMNGEKIDLFDPFRKNMNAELNILLQEMFQGLNLFILSFVGLAGVDKSSILSKLFETNHIQGEQRTKIHGVRKPRGVTIQLYRFSDKDVNPIGYDGFLILDFKDFYSCIPELKSLKYAKQDEFERKLMALALTCSDLVLMGLENDEIGPEFFDLLNISFLEAGKQEITKSPDMIFIQRQSPDYAGTGIETKIVSNFTKLNETIGKIEYDIGSIMQSSKLLWKLFRRIEKKTLISVLSDANLATDFQNLKHEILASTNNSLTVRSERILGNWYKSTTEKWWSISSSSFTASLDFINLELSEHLKSLKTAKQNLDQAVAHHKAECILKLRPLDMPDKEQINELKMVLESIPDSCKIENEDKPCAYCEAILEVLKELKESFVHTFYTSYRTQALETSWTEINEFIYTNELRRSNGITAIVTKILEEHTNTKPTPVSKIYHEIQGLYSTKQTIIPWSRKFLVDIHEEYSMSPHVIKAMENETHRNYELNVNKIPNGELIKRKIYEVPRKIISSFLHNGAYSTHGIIRKCKNEFDSILHRTEKILALPLDFIWNAHIYGLGLLFEAVNSYEENWNKKHGLMENLEKFRKEIEQEIKKKLENSDS